MWFRILGRLHVCGASREIPIVAQRQQIILMMTLLEANRIIPVDRLIEAVWDDSPPATAKGQVQICISMLRRMLAEAGLPDVISTARNGYVARVPPNKLDRTIFDTLTRKAHVAAAEQRFTDADELFRDALALWRGRSLTTGNSRVLQGVEARLVQELISAVEQWTDVRLQLGLHHGLAGYLTELVDDYPLREGLRARLMRVLYRSSQQAEALEVYRTGRRLLVDELGIEPGEELQRVERAILNGSLDPAPQAAAPAAALPVAAVNPRMLPTDIPDFTGHAEPLRQLREHLLTARDGSAQSVPVAVVCGKAGVGKTTLATHVGHALADDFPDGQLFVQLNGLSPQRVTVAQTLERFLRALGIAGNSMPERVEERAEIYRQLVAHRRILIVLDDAMDEEQVRWLIPGTASCAVVVTSRFRLTGLPGAATIYVEVFDTEQAMQMLVKVVGSDLVYGELGEAMRLVEICGGLPIALRIAAARLASRPHWSIGQFVQRIVNESQRLNELVHRGLGVRATLALTYEALGESAQRLFRRLGMLESYDFAGWLAAPLLGASTQDAEEALEELVDAQFVDVERAGRAARLRFRLHDLIRTYARERLAYDESPDERAAALARTLGSWLFLAEQAHRKAYGGDHTLVHGNAARWPLPAQVVESELVDPIQWYESERDGILAAVRQAAGSGMDELCWDLALTSVTLFEARSYFDDWRITHEIALAETRRTGNRRGEAAMLHSLGTLRLYEQRFAEAGSRLLAAERLFAEVGDEHGQGLALRNLAFLDRIQGRIAAAEQRCEQALVRLRAAGDKVGEAHVLGSLAKIELERNAVDAAEIRLTRALELAGAAGNRRVRCQLLCWLGDARLARKDDLAAEQTFRDVLAEVQDYGDQVGEAYARYGLGVALARQHQTEAAESQLVKAQEQASYLDHRLLGGQIRMALGQIQLERGCAEEALEHLSQALQTFGELEMGTWRARALLAVGDAYRCSGQSDAAAMAWREGLALADTLEPMIIRPVVDELRSRLGG